jgi:hypothetical protein
MSADGSTTVFLPIWSSYVHLHMRPTFGALDFYAFKSGVVVVVEVNATVAPANTVVETCQR